MIQLWVFYAVGGTCMQKENKLTDKEISQIEFLAFSLLLVFSPMANVVYFCVFICWELELGCWFIIRIAKFSGNSRVCFVNVNLNEELYQFCFYYFKREETKTCVTFRIHISFNYLANIFYNRQSFSINFKHFFLQSKWWHDRRHRKQKQK